MKNLWRSAAPLLDGIHPPGVAVLPDAGWLYGVGSGIKWDPRAGRQVYDPAMNTWSYLPDTFSDYHRAGNGFTYVAGRLLLPGTHIIYPIELHSDITWLDFAKVADTLLNKETRNRIASLTRPIFSTPA